MARLGTCGWELLSTTDGGFWDSATGSISAGSARTGDRGYVATGNFQFCSKNFKATGSTDDYFGRVWVNPVTSPDAQVPIIRAQDQGSGLFSWEIRANTDDTLELWKVGSTPAQIGSDSAALTGYSSVTWEYDQSTATVTAYLNGVSFASGAVNAADDNLSQITIGFFDPSATFTTGEYHFDDFAHNDQTGTVENGLPDWRGACYVTMPDAAGDNAMGARGGSDSGSDFGQVDERPPNDATDYYILDVNNDILDLTCTTGGGALPAGATVKVVNVGARIRASSAASMSFRLRIKSQAAGTVQSSAVITKNDVAWETNGDTGTTTVTNYPLAAYVDPQSSGPWTAALLDGMQIGVISPDAAPDCWITTLWAYVEYVEVTEIVQDLILMNGIIPFLR